MDRWGQVRTGEVRRGQVWTGVDLPAVAALWCSSWSTTVHPPSSALALAAVSDSAALLLRSLTGLFQPSPHESHRFVSAFSSQVSQVCFSFLLTSLTDLFQLTLLLTNLTGLFQLSSFKSNRSVSANSSPLKSHRSISTLFSQISQVCFSSLLANLTGLFQLTLLLSNLTGLFQLSPLKSHRSVSTNSSAHKSHRSISANWAIFLHTNLSYRSPWVSGATSTNLNPVSVKHHERRSLSYCLNKSDLCISIFFFFLSQSLVCNQSQHCRSHTLFKALSNPRHQTLQLSHTISQSPNLSYWLQIQYKHSNLSFTSISLHSKALRQQIPSTTLKTDNCCRWN